MRRVKKLNQILIDYGIDASRIKIVARGVDTLYSDNGAQDFVKARYVTVVLDN